MRWRNKYVAFELLRAEVGAREEKLTYRLVRYEEHTNFAAWGMGCRREFAKDSGCCTGSCHQEGGIRLELKYGGKIC
jgi:hypothetical protein